MNFLFKSCPIKSLDLFANFWNKIVVNVTHIRMNGIDFRFSPSNVGKLFISSSDFDDNESFQTDC